MNKIFSIFTLCVVPAWALAAEQVQIGTVLQRPAEYHLHVITLHGVVSQVQSAGDLYNYKYASVCLGAYTFILRDDSGSIAVEVPSICARSQDSIPLVKENQTVNIDARIEASGWYAGQGRPLGELVSATRAVAVKIELE